MSSHLELTGFHGSALEPHLDALGRLRIAVFREYPYLYEGTLEYERDYLQTYCRSERSLVVLMFDGAEVVGATTCLPMTDEGPEFQEPFINAGRDLATICYFGESILLPPYRGRGIGKEFFRRREEHARRLGARVTTFCAVDRPPDHPRRPPGYEPLDAMWTKQGYAKHSDLKATFVWKEIGEPAESPKTLTFWLKEWPPA
ncbi:MAG: GNAT family N-acetyltransferase [Verrucomicrobiaceae bacterium]|nr:GNAT family N-acetyltransferase [Verrucomicrobiaceae bacterium]